MLSRFDPAKDNFKDIVIRAQPEAVEGLAYAGFNILSLANNHIMQHGQKGLENTIDILNKHGIKYIGVEIPKMNICNRATFDIRGLSICFLGYNLRPQQYFIDQPLYVEGNFDKIANDIEQVKTQTDLIVISLHWGDEFVNQPSPEQIVLAHKIIDCGADIILGHHSHILQGVETYKGKIIAYSLGNFIFDFWQTHLRNSMILKLKIIDPSKIDYDIIPIRINARCQPSIDSGQAQNNIESIQRRISQLLDNPIDMDDYGKIVDREYKKFRREVVIHYLFNAYRYNPKFLYSNLIGAIKRRLI